MRTSLFKWMRLGLILLILVGFTSAGSLAAPTRAAAQTAPPSVGIVCTYGPTFNLYAVPGHIVLGDGNTMYMWSYSLGAGPEAFQHPGPVLCVNEGETVTVILHNTLPEDASIMFPGQENVLANGAPAQPQFDGSGNVTSLTNVAPTGGGSMTYSFVASHPGTFLYESGTNPEKQVRMGLFGTLIVRPGAVPAGGTDSDPAHYAYDRKESQFTPGEEFLVLLSDIDPLQHQAAEQNMAFDLTQYHPHYWLVNGRTFPDSVADNFASWLPNQPYGALARIHPFNNTVAPTDPAYHPYPALARYINVGFEDYSFHPHGNNGWVIGRDGRPLVDGSGADLSFEKFAFNIGPGQTFDTLFRWYDAENYGGSKLFITPTDGTLGGTFTLTFNGQETGSIPYSADASVIKTALESLSNIETVSVSGTGTQADPWIITFVSPTVDPTEEPLVANDSGLINGASTVIPNSVPVTVPDPANLTYGMFYSGSPYLGKTGPLQPGASTLNQCGEFYIIAHNHALFQLDAWGVTMAGQITYMRVDPPLPNNCPQ